MNRLAEWEALTHGSQVFPEDVTNINKALEIWEANKNELSEIPGLNYIEDTKEQEPTEEEHEIAKLTGVLLRMIIEKEIAADEKEERLEKAERNGVHMNRDHQSSSSSPLQEHATLNKDAAGQKISSPSTPRTTSTPNTPKSILKRKTSFTPPDAAPQKRARIADLVTISPPSLNRSNFSPWDKRLDMLITRVHAPYTSEEHKRRTDTFRRSSVYYKPGSWVSCRPWRMAETSNYKVSWDRAEKRVAEELKEEEDERKVYMGLKMVAWTWMITWWIRNVTRHLDLKQLQAKLAAK